MRSPNGVCVIDMETRGIGPRPNEYPPEPVGVAIRYPDGKRTYLSWGHPSGNNTTFEDARRELWQLWNLYPILCHNAAFDFEVAHRWFGFNLPRRWHDTYFSLFLNLPHRQTYSLKPTAQDLLGEAPDERDAMRDWAVANLAGVTAKNYMAHVSRIPAEIVGPYAIGDVDRTYELHSRFYPYVERDMLAAYEREKALMPLLVNASRNGIRVNRRLLSSWESTLSASIAEADKRITYILGGAFNVDSNDELADMVERAGLLRPEGWELTSTGKRSLSKKAFAAAVPSAPTLVELVSYRNTAATLLRTFVVRWLDDSATDERLHCQWHQTRSDDGGARTGRISSSNPNLANVPNPQDKITVPAGLAALPNLREALLPEEGHTWLSADYSGQELRVLAHYEDNQLPAAYRANPRLDQHQQARDMIEAVSGLKIDRKSAKIVGFALIYGAGDRKLAEQLGVDVVTAATLRRAYLQAIPGVAHVQRMAMDRWGRGRPIKTWGGRLVPPQPPSIINGRRVTWEYKALNMLIQGSSADQTKEAIIRLHRIGAGLGLVLLSQLYDELNVSVPTDNLRDGAEAMREAMTEIPGFDVPFVIDAEIGPTWGTMQPYSFGAKQ